MLLKVYHGWIWKKTFTKFDEILSIVVLRITHIQFLLGLSLYFISPIVRYFLNNFKEAVHIRQIRFFGMEHITVMLIAISLITIGTEKSKLKKTDIEKFKTLSIWYSIALFLILTSIPWQFSPLTSRPYYRPF
ncbi:hypothetical protein [Hufsiella arboris]|nr:hypothetical protein [Hufsiella arboris]